MRVAVVGGKLQGVEACYLAKKAGWEVFLIDKKDGVPAQGLCDEFYLWDVTKQDAQLSALFQKVDFILPALENKEAHAGLIRWADKLDVPLVFDRASYEISCSKIDSNQVFRETGIPMPKLWPECTLPLVVKPSGSSGSDGVFKVRDREDLEKLQERPEILETWVVQEFVEGPSYSIEVIGWQGHFTCYQVTELEMDEHYDCKRVLAPAGLDFVLENEFVRIGERIARHLNLSGIMDVEVILHEGQLKVLEIDARLPSQTPTVVYQSSGINMVEILGNHCTQVQGTRKKEWPGNRGAVYEHISVSMDAVKVCGEHIMSEAGPLHLIPDFFGADEAITNYCPGKKDWVATLIISGADRQEAWEKRCRVIDQVRQELSLDHYIDLLPEG
ncbi:3-methylornithine--L-lysine ligase PylC [Candidatus Formimonas warabiya]|uniref:3-methylornithine--L-lysine ligase PylC n=1 Tax=Formimonas warabiya TaxID=1761012 RepID=A0A3G1L0E4_FORW1|nr:3-methylornithine--L-lysine ligase PylC [Candidatus Formimonas warabiya]ATW28109.1 3-methylornithine--L-lysine ligase PylC [Candidatus Formimonas warabiya]